ncbi:hypothetical protein D3C84_1168670 [compost metagenome]
MIGLIDLEAQVKVSRAVQFELHTATEKQVPRIHAESIPILMYRQARRTVLAPQAQQPFVLGANRRALFLWRALGWLGCCAQ